MSQQQEIWKPIDGFPNYFVSNLGRIQSTKHKKPRLMYISPGDPYPRVELSHRGRQYRKRVHRLVAEAFHGAGPEGCEVRHLNGIFTDCRAENLQWGSRSENILDAVRHGTHHWASKTHCPRDHEYTPENTIRSSRGSRACRSCKQEDGRRYQAERRAADPDARNAYQRQWRASRKALAAANVRQASAA